MKLVPAATVTKPDPSKFMPEKVRLKCKLNVAFQLTNNSWKSPEKIVRYFGK